MNIPGDELYTLLHAALKNVGQRRSSARSILLCGRPYCAEGFGPAAICPAHERWRIRSRCPEIPSTRRWTSSRSKVICCVAAGTRVGQFAPRTIARTLPDPDVRLTKRVARLPAPVPRDTPVMAFTPGTPAINYFPLPLWRRLYDRVLREEEAPC